MRLPAAPRPTPQLLLATATAIMLLLGLATLVIAQADPDEADGASVIVGATTPDPAPPITSRPAPAGSEAMPLPGGSPTPGAAGTASPGTAPSGGPAAPPAPGASPGGPAPAPPGSGVQAALPVGTCLTVPPRATDASSVTPIDCAEPHNGEVFVSVVLTQPADAPYPGEEPLRDDSRLLCEGEAFEAYVGVPYTESRLFAYPLFPSETSWAAGDRDVSCFLTDLTSLSTGSAQGSGR